MNDYYLLQTAKHTAAERIAEAERARLARTSRAAARTRSSSPSTGRAHRPGLSLGSLLHRVAFF